MNDHIEVLPFEETAEGVQHLAKIAAIQERRAKARIRGPELTAELETARKQLDAIIANGDGVAEEGAETHVKALELEHERLFDPRRRETLQNAEHAAKRSLQDTKERYVASITPALHQEYRELIKELGAKLAAAVESNISVDRFQQKLSVLGCDHWNACFPGLAKSYPFDLVLNNGVNVGRPTTTPYSIWCSRLREKHGCTTPDETTKNEFDSARSAAVASAQREQESELLGGVEVERRLLSPLQQAARNVLDSTRRLIGLRG